MVQERPQFEEAVTTGEGGESESRRRKRKKESRFSPRALFLTWTFILVLFGSILVWNPFPQLFQRAEARTPDTMTTGEHMVDIFERWLAEQGGSEFLGGVLLTAALIGAAGQFRRYLLNRSKLWTHSCPKCGNFNLRRARRHWLDRVLNLIGIPIRRYHCSNCHWRGRRLGSS